MTKSIDILNGMLLDDTTHISVEELLSLCNIPDEVLVEMVAEGLLQPLGERREEWSFSGPQIHRARMASRLLSDLEVNMAGAALACDLLDEIRELRRRVAALEHQLGLRR
ncbi:MAG TPA: MerR family transcriptional regulator [Chromatiales bacterium]|nr:MerR family transcriptional regulator [Chromatiales bacterium]